MRVSLRSILIAGVSTLAVSSIAMAPVRPIPEERVVAQVAAPVHLTAAVAPLRPPNLSSALADIPAIADELDLSLAVGDVATQNAASDFVTWFYEGLVEWSAYLALELAPWALGWIPFGGVITNQIWALYPPIIDFTDSVVYDLIDPVLNNPLNPAVWANGISAVAYSAVASLLNAGINEINLVIDYFLGWLPPLPPIPPWPPFPGVAETTLAATADTLAPQALLPGLIGGPVTAVSDVAAGVAHSLVNLWYPPSGLIDSGVGIASNVLNAFSWLPLVGVANFQLNEVWGLLHTEGNTLAQFTNDLIDIANDLVANTLQDGLAPALEDAFYTGLQSLQTHGDAAVDGLRNFALDQLQYLTGVWVPHTTSPRVDLPQGPPDVIRYSVPQVLRDILGPLSGLIPSGTLGSVPLGAAGLAAETGVAASEEKSAPALEEAAAVTETVPAGTTDLDEAAEGETAEGTEDSSPNDEAKDDEAKDDEAKDDDTRFGEKDRTEPTVSDETDVETEGDVAEPEETEPEKSKPEETEPEKAEPTEKAEPAEKEAKADTDTSAGEDD